MLNVGTMASHLQSTWLTFHRVSKQSWTESLQYKMLGNPFEWLWGKFQHFSSETTQPILKLCRLWKSLNGWVSWFNTENVHRWIHRSRWVASCLTSLSSPPNEVERDEVLGTTKLLNLLRRLQRNPVAFRKHTERMTGVCTRITYYGKVEKGKLFTCLRSFRWRFCTDATREDKYKKVIISFFFWKKLASLEWKCCSVVKV